MIASRAYLQQQALQERCIIWSTHEVRHQRRWPRNLRRDSQRNLRQPRHFKDTSWQGFQSRLLLANGSGRRQVTSSEMKMLSILHKTATCADLQASHNTSNMA